MASAATDVHPVGDFHSVPSFALVDETEASGVLTDVLREHQVYLGGSSFGKGLQKAARYYLQEHLPAQFHQELKKLGSAHPTDLNPDVLAQPIIEDSFYVVDLGVVVNQVYQWRRFFPRVEPFYAVKCNPDPVIIKTLAILGCNFDCASRNEIRLVQQMCKDLQLPRTPEIIYANPCKARAHLIEAVCRGVRMVTFDNTIEVQKIASISKKIELVMRIITDDRGSQCRLSSKFGAPRIKWRPLLAAAKKHGLKVVGVSFHVGSGCRDAGRYEAALKDAREIFDMAKAEFGFEMYILDIGGGFPGETHSLWNPAVEIDELDGGYENEGKENNEVNQNGNGLSCVKDENSGDRFMFFTEIAEQVAPIIDQLFPEPCRIIGEPGRYLVAASSTLCCSVVSCRNNAVDSTFMPEQHNDQELAKAIHEMSRMEEKEVVNAVTRTSSMSFGDLESDDVLKTIHAELVDYSKLYASQLLVQQEFDVYNDAYDCSKEDMSDPVNLLGPPDEGDDIEQKHTVEGLSRSLVNTVATEEESTALLTLAAAGEAAVNGMVLQAVADSAPLQDDYAYYINDGVYGAFNNLMFDHASTRPRVLRLGGKTIVVASSTDDGLRHLESDDSSNHSSDEKADINVNANGNENRKGSPKTQQNLYASTVFGPTCDSIDVIARSVLLPKLEIGDYLYFTNMGAYTMAAASAFNGFTPSEKLYVCSVQPEYFEALIAGPPADEPVT